ncbi:glycosyltransferase family 2 protein, partial [Candidatus Amesbacteria bacterium]|nr:glycosyltransferase family 2 protein [Candidatus Amesbacteria bacterium]
YSIIIPAHNEEKTIGHVLDALCKSTASEIIVIDDGSIDHTRNRVLDKTDSRIRLISHHQNMGQGNALKTGITNSTAPILVFFDADIETATPEMIKRLVNPILTGQSDYVIGGFDNFGRITEYLVRPLLRQFTPELSAISQPRSGLFAAKREFIYPEKIGNRYITIGLVLDAYFSGAKIKDVSIGPIKHNKRSDREKADQANSECEVFFKKLAEYAMKDQPPGRWSRFAPDLVHSITQ